MLDNIEAVIFDLDGTLIDSMWIWKEIDIQFLEKRGLALPEDLQREIEGMSFTETAKYFKDRFKLKESIEAIKAEWDIMVLNYYKEKVTLKENVREIIDNLKSSNIKLGIGTSNSKDRTIDILKKFGLLEYFSSIRTSCEVNKGKPNPDVFLKVAEDLEVAPEKCLVFEDTYAGVLAAKRAGMKVYAVEDESSIDYREELIELADGYIRKYEEMA
ncbi:HAD family hydrolase [Dethiothermospora halolimnae]|uniref:HAD family hydrolase n=1 Tax=Dethiothermospora halolimnae TaxID=3114390 RepID=UPI003CCC2E1D